MVAAALGPAEYESIRQKLAQMPEPPARPRLGKEQWFGALAVCLWVILTTFPVAIPFIFMDDVARAMRVSNGIAVVLLFVTGLRFRTPRGVSPVADWHRHGRLGGLSWPSQWPWEDKDMRCEVRRNPWTPSRPTRTPSPSPSRGQDQTTPKSGHE